MCEEASLTGDTYGTSHEWDEEETGHPRESEIVQIGPEVAMLVPVGRGEGRGRAGHSRCGCR